MKPVYIRLQDLLSELVPSAADRCDVLTTAMALAHSRVVSIPSGPVPSPAAYYNQQVVSSVDECLTKLNEYLPFDLKCARNETRQFWMLRYGAAHPQMLPLISDVGFVDTICSAPLYLDKDLICFANEFKMPILQLTVEILNMLEDEQRKVA